MLLHRTTETGRFCAAWPTYSPSWNYSFPSQHLGFVVLKTLVAFLGHKIADCSVPVLLLDNPVTNLFFSLSLLFCNTCLFWAINDSLKSSPSKEWLYRIYYLMLIEVLRGILGILICNRQIILSRLECIFVGPRCVGNSQHVSTTAQCFSEASMQAPQEYVRNNRIIEM